MILTIGTFAGTGDSLPADTSATPLRIAHIYLNGNRITKPYVVKAFLQIDTGNMYDSTQVDNAKKRLKATGLFSKVDIIHLHKTYGTDLYVILSEYPGIIFPPDVGWYPYNYRYGRSHTWYCPFAGLQFTNLGGRMERLGIFAKVGEWQTYSAHWTKPLFPSRYEICLGAAYDRSPDYSINLIKKEVCGNITVARRFFELSKAYLSIIPDYRWNREWDDSSSYVSHYSQAYGALGWLTDHCSSAFDPSHGWRFQFETRSNYLYNESMGKPYVQFLSDVKWYHPFFFNEHKLACHFYFLVRTSDAGYLNRVLIGGENSVRGYYTGQIGLRTIANDAFFFSGEYRFPLYESPGIILPVPSFVKSLAGQFTYVAPRLDGALILDYGRVSRFPHQLFSMDTRSYQSGADIGFGLRILEQSLRLRGSFDIIWSDNITTSRIDFYSRPFYHLYGTVYF